MANAASGDDGVVDRILCFFNGAFHVPKSGFHVVCRGHDRRDHVAAVVVAESMDRGRQVFDGRLQSVYLRLGVVEDVSRILQPGLRIRQLGLQFAYALLESVGSPVVATSNAQDYQE